MSHLVEQYLENKRAYIRLRESSHQIGGGKIVVKGMKDGYADEILRKLIKLIKNYGIPSYVKRWKRYKMKSRYSSIEKFNIDLKRLAASYHHHTFITYKNRYVATPEDRKRWLELDKERKKKKNKKINELPRKIPDFKLYKNGIGKITVYHFHMNFKNNEASAESIKDQNSHIKAIQTQLRKWKRQNIKGLIIDFRQHGGGSVIHLYKAFADIFEGATIYGWKNSQARKSDKIWINVDNNEVLYEQKYSSNNLNWTIPIAVIIGGDTSSSGEFGAIMFYGRSNTRFFGARSSGHLSGNNMKMIDDDYVLIITESLVNSPDLTFHKSERIEPDVVTDTPIKSARKWILKQS
jgi:C-terminal processing protease CtpA/Prc